MEIELQETLGKIISRLGEGVTMKNVWTTPTLTGDFVAQDIEVDLSDGELVLIVYIGDYGNGHYESMITPVGTAAMLKEFTHVGGTSSEPPYVFGRKAVTSTNKIHFDDCYLRLTNNASYNSVQNLYCKPYKIYSIKLNSNQRYLAPDYMEDYVVEHGTSGIWTYRKWASGLAECWGRWSGSASSYVGPYGSAFYGFQVKDIIFPFEFAELPDFIHYVGNIGNTFTMPAQSNLDLKTTGTNLYFIATTSGTQNAYAEIEVKGKWK